MGDPHGQYARIHGELSELPRGSSVIILGDNEFFHPHDLVEFDEFVEEFECRLYLMRGNHDKPKFWADPKKWKEDLGLKNLTLLDEVDYTFWRGKSIVTVNGAVSVDRKCIRFDRGECWPGEEGIPADAVQRVKVLGPCDILLTHAGNPDTHTVKNEFIDAYASTDFELEGDIAKERLMIQKLQIVSECKRHYFGHFHTSWKGGQFGIKSRCLNVTEIVEVIG